MGSPEWGDEHFSATVLLFAVLIGAVLYRIGHALGLVSANGSVSEAGEE